jgi:hypothetical protein
MSQRTLQYENRFNLIKILTCMQTKKPIKLMIGLDRKNIIA